LPENKFYSFEVGSKSGFHQPSVFPSFWQKNSLNTKNITTLAQMQEMSTEVSNYFEGKASGVYTLEISWGEKREYHKVILRR
jgi:hypothetical protein